MRIEHPKNGSLEILIDLYFRSNVYQMGKFGKSLFKYFLLDWIISLVLELLPLHCSLLVKSPSFIYFFSAEKIWMRKKMVNVLCWVSEIRYHTKKLMQKLIINSKLPIDFCQLYLVCLFSFNKVGWVDKKEWI